MPRRSWMDDPQWQMRENNPNPQFRPSVDHLVSQLRRHKALKEHPDAVEFIIKDLSHRFLVRDDQRPEIIWQIVDDLMHQFQGLMPPGKQGFEDWTEKQMDFPNKLVESMTGEVLTAPHALGEQLHNYLEHQTSRETHSDSRIILFGDQFLKNGIEGVILRHRGHEYVQGKVKCRCGRFYDTPDEWSSHVRIRIWRFFRNEFPPIPAADSESESMVEIATTV